MQQEPHTQNMLAARGLYSICITPVLHGVRLSGLSIPLASGSIVVPRDRAKPSDHAYNLLLVVLLLLVLMHAGAAASCCSTLLCCSYP